jgi:hypothetical protein
MDTLLLVALAAGAAYAFLGRDRLEQLVTVAHAKLPSVELRHVVGAGLLAALALVWSGRNRTEPTPAPPAPDAPLVLRGLFNAHPEAASDAAKLAALFGELAGEVEWDAMQSTPIVTSGVAFDDLRVRAFDLRLRGDSIGDRHPRVRSAVKDYLDRVAGTSGKPLTPEQRATWIAAYREVAAAAEAAAK